MTLPHFPFYASDWLAATIDMTATERGAYIQLLSLSWDRDGLPDDLARLAAMAGVPEIPTAVLEKLPIAEDGKRRNPKLERVRAESLRLHGKKVAAGKLGGRPKAELKQNESSALAEAKQNESSAFILLKQNESNHNHNHNIVPSELTSQVRAHEGAGRPGTIGQGRTLAEIVEEQADKIGMSSEEQVKFLAYWMSENTDGVPLWQAKGPKGWSPAARVRSWMDRAASPSATGRDRPGNGGFREPPPVSSRSMLASPEQAKQIFGEE